MRLLILTLALATLSACATIPANRYPETRTPLEVSGEIRKGISGPGGLTIGLIADSQLQTRSNSRHVRVYRDKRADALVNVAIRPPALDYASRALLRHQLHSLRNSGAEAIFYLGDGANNGCEDEMLAGFDPARPVPKDEEGLLTILNNFRAQNPGIAVFFVLGNHDFLGAGSTPRQHKRVQFCDPENPAMQNRSLSKLEVMAAVDAFNRGNPPQWAYRTNFSDATRGNCGSVDEKHFEKPGCYLAAVVDTEIDGLKTQFVLLDSNDWSSVKRFWFLGEQLGVWGGLSFGSEEPMSQIRWFEDKTSEPVAMRLLMSHYNVGAIVKKSPLGSLSHLSRHVPSLVSSPGTPRTRRQNAAFFITAHTHTEEVNDKLESELRATACTTGKCSLTQDVVTKELNIGSTTDFRNSAVLLRVRPANSAGEGSIEYQQVEVDPKGECARYKPLIEANQASFGINPADRFDYVRNDHKRNTQIWDNMRVWTKDEPMLAVCIGHYAARLEEEELDERGYEHIVKE